MDEINEVVEITETEARDAEETKKSWISRAKEKLINGFETVKEYVTDNPEVCIYAVYGSYMAYIFGATAKYMHTVNKTADLDYNMKLLKGIKEL